MANLKFSFKDDEFNMSNIQNTKAKVFKQKNESWMLCLKRYFI